MHRFCYVFQSQYLEETNFTSMSSFFFHLNMFLFPSIEDSFFPTFLKVRRLCLWDHYLCLLFFDFTKIFATASCPMKPEAFLLIFSSRNILFPCFIKCRLLLSSLCCKKQFFSKFVHLKEGNPLLDFVRI